MCAYTATRAIYFYKLLLLLFLLQLLRILLTSTAAIIIRVRVLVLCYVSATRLETSLLRLPGTHTYHSHTGVSDLGYCCSNVTRRYV